MLSFIALVDHVYCSEKHYSDNWDLFPNCAYGPGQRQIKLAFSKVVSSIKLEAASQLLLVSNVPVVLMSRCDRSARRQS